MTVEEREEWSSRIKPARLAKGLKQTELAEAADVSPRTLMSAENGQRIPQQAVLSRILDVLQIGPAYGYVIGVGSTHPDLRIDGYMNLIRELFNDVPEDRWPTAMKRISRVLISESVNDDSD